jgi:hypothetical protein
MSWLLRLTPRIAHRYLYIIAALVWTIAGSMLLFRGMMLFLDDAYFIWTRLSISIVSGILFYRFLFLKISTEHTSRISRMQLDRPCLFSFFNMKSYILMTVMITVGITLRKSGIISPVYLSFIYVTMGIPLFISSFRFYRAFAVYQSK